MHLVVYTTYHSIHTAYKIAVDVSMHKILLYLMGT